MTRWHGIQALFARIAAIQLTRVRAVAPRWKTAPDAMVSSMSPFFSAAHPGNAMSGYGPSRRFAAHSFPGGGIPRRGYPDPALACALNRPFRQPGRLGFFNEVAHGGEPANLA